MGGTCPAGNRNRGHRVAARRELFALAEAVRQGFSSANLLLVAVTLRESEKPPRPLEILRFAQHDNSGRDMIKSYKGCLEN
jgi:hypothetical protein